MSLYVKSGKLILGTKSLFKRRNKHIFAGIRDSQMLIYSNARDNKPIYALDLKKCKIVENKSEKETHYFELTNSEQKLFRVSD